MVKKESQPKTRKPKTARVCLLGFMGASKTSVAAALAEKINCESFDLDEFIEARENHSPAHIIENLGEAIFREIETEALRELLRLNSANIVALGGGTWMIEENRRLIEQQKFRAVWLDAPFELCWQRVKKAKTARPLAKNKKQAQKLFDERRDVYSAAEIHVKIESAQTVWQIAEEIYAGIVKPKPKSKK